jgi:phage repressor protein C with HTH and peptisase S24 domain
VGDSNVPSLNPGEKVIVNPADKVPSPPGFFVVWDGLALVLKRVEYVPHSDPPRVRISSDNPRYQPYERTLEEAYIQGRVIGSWQRR